MKVWGAFSVENNYLFGLFTTKEIAREAIGEENCKNVFFQELKVNGLNDDIDPILLHYSTLSRVNSFQSQLDLIKTCLLRLQDKVDGIK